VQSSTKPNGNQPAGWNKKKGLHNHKGGKIGNKSKDNNEKTGNGGRLCINTVDAKIDIATRSQDYSSKQTIPGLESPPPPPEMTLHIEKPEPEPCIPKGVLKRSTHNPNARASLNYSILLRTWAKPLMLCRLWRYSRRVLHRGIP
jgi:hypothetical protein